LLFTALASLSPVDVCQAGACFGDDAEPLCHTRGGNETNSFVLPALYHAMPTQRLALFGVQRLAGGGLDPEGSFS
jgi:hypothetical protein